MDLGWFFFVPTAFLCVAVAAGCARGSREERARLKRHREALREADEWRRANGFE